MSFDNVPGVVIDHMPASTGCYLGSPSVAILPNGTYLASRDKFGPASSSDTATVFASEDRGVSWREIGDVTSAFWSNLFVHRGEVYLMGANRRFGGIVIRRSSDGGASWSDPESGSTGLLRTDGEYHTAPMPIVEHSGRLWRAFEDMYPRREWAKNFRALVMSIPVDADVLDAGAWTFANPLAGDPSWLGGEFGGWLEGNAVVAPDGQIVDMLRVDFRQHPTEKAALVRLSADGKTATFSPEDFVDFPGGCKKFTVRQDPLTGLYFSLSNYVPGRFSYYNTERARNSLALLSSEDLRSWEVRRMVLQHEDPENHAFQYVDWQFDGPDLIAVSRTAYDDGLGGADNQHNANFITFHRVIDFRGNHP
jgi:hypothetical protein